MLKSIDLMYQTMLAELGQRSLDAVWSADFPSDGRFTPASLAPEAGELLALANVSDGGHFEAFAFLFGFEQGGVVF
ncbi:hypothetical protein M1D34_26130 (plasmid) [Ensifer sp. D2-11]